MLCICHKHKPINKWWSDTTGIFFIQLLDLKDKVSTTTIARIAAPQGLRFLLFYFNKSWFIKLLEGWLNSWLAHQMTWRPILTLQPWHHPGVLPKTIIRNKTMIRKKVSLNQWDFFFFFLQLCSFYMCSCGVCHTGLFVPLCCCELYLCTHQCVNEY